MIPEKLGNKEYPKGDVHRSPWEGKGDKTFWEKLGGVRWEDGREGGEKKEEEEGNIRNEMLKKVVGQ